MAMAMRAHPAVIEDRGGGERIERPGVVEHGDRHCPETVEKTDLPPVAVLRDVANPRPPDAVASSQHPLVEVDHRKGPHSALASSGARHRAARRRTRRRSRCVRSRPGSQVKWSCRRRRPGRESRHGTDRTATRQVLWSPGVVAARRRPTTAPIRSIDPPAMPILPVHHGCLASHSIAS